MAAHFEFILMLVVVIANGAVVQKVSETPARSAASDRLIAAMIVVESNGDDWAVGDGRRERRAVGPLQIRQPCLDDVNRRFKTKIELDDVLGNRALSVWVCERYFEIYATRKRLGRDPTDQDLARIWNGGPDGFRKNATRRYWSKVEKALTTIPLPKSSNDLR